jgi:hypothetical protein
MANSAGMGQNFKFELMQGLHAFGPGGSGIPPARTVNVPDVIKAALFLATATRVPGDAAYNTTGELAATGNYTQGGKTVTQATAPSLDTTTGIFTPSANLTWTALTSSGSFDCIVFYNSSQSNKQISVHTFTAQSIVAADFTLTMPANTAAAALLRIA